MRKGIGNKLRLEIEQKYNAEIEINKIILYIYLIIKN